MNFYFLFNFILASPSHKFKEIIIVYMYAAQLILNCKVDFKENKNS